jgi:Tfp pilus assembly protein PilF
LLGLGVEAGTHAKLRQQAMQRLAEDEKTLAALEKSAKDGNEWGQVAEVFASKGLWDRANEAYAKALDQGGLKREAELRLHYGISLFKAQQVAGARNMLSSVRGEATAVELASLWLLRVK